MSRVDLDNIQAQLKVAIQSHQILVAKMKSDPQNLNLQKQLHQLQSQITSLSEKQRSIVQLLRKELVNKQEPTVQTPASIGATKPIHSQTCLVTCAVIPAQPVSAINLTQQVQPTNLSTAKTNSIHPPPTSSPSKTPAFITPKPVLHTSQLLTPQQLIISQAAPQHRGPSPQQQQHRGASPQQHRGASPPIRVPQYPVHRPSILQGHRQSLSLHHKPAATSTSQPLPTAVSSAPRKPAPTTAELARDIKKAVFDKKLLSPEEKRKVDFMASLDLVTHEAVKELQNKRSERKRRSTANPQFSYGSFDHEQRKRSYLTSVLPAGVKRPRGRPPKNPPEQTINHPIMPPEGSDWQYSADVITSGGNNNADGDRHEDFCAVCNCTGELLMCDTCNLVYHLLCLNPPLNGIPQGAWSCPRCQKLSKSSEPFPGTLAIVHSYIAHKTGKEEEKRKLQKRQSELENDRGQLETKAKQLSDTITKQIHHKSEMISNSRSTQQTVDKLKSFIKVFQST